MHYFPLTTPFFLLLLLVAGVLIALVEVNVLAYSYEKIGVSRRYVFALLLLSLLGSYLNIPVAQLGKERMVAEHVVTFFGVDYVVPVMKTEPGTIVAVNVGGAVIPVCLSLFLFFKNRLFLSGIIGVVLMTAVIHWMAHPVQGVGIAVPVLVPPLVSAGLATLLARRHAPALAYISGSLGTLIGADLLNLYHIRGLGAPVASIGGAGTFDGIFLTGVIAVLLTQSYPEEDRSA